MSAVATENSIFISDKAKAKVIKLMEEAGVAGGVFVGGGAEVVDDFALGLLARDGQVAGEAVLSGDHFKERVDGGRADVGEHLEAFGGGFG